jgi:hypothetical protein
MPSIHAAALVAQLAGPNCGLNLGAEITPGDAWFTGCTVPSITNPQGVRLWENPFSPAGVTAEPAGPALPIGAP